MWKRKYTCPCCEFKTLDSAPGLFDICPVCYWEDDNIQRNDPYYKGGPNSISLNEARQNYRNIGAISSEYLTYVRPPSKDEN
jgi:hypothetical protein